MSIAAAVRLQGKTAWPCFGGYMATQDKKGYILDDGVKQQSRTQNTKIHAP